MNILNHCFGKNTAFLESDLRKCMKNLRYILLDQKFLFWKFIPRKSPEFVQMYTKLFAKALIIIAKCKNLYTEIKRTIFEQTVVYWLLNECLINCGMFVYGHDGIQSY